jgi:hypothetical protein
MQILFDFSHQRENNSFSQSIYESQYERLSNNCQILLKALLRGERLTGADVVKKYGMLEYRRRFADIKAAGIPVKDEMVGNVKQWYL